MTAARVDDTFARRVSARLEDPDARAPRRWPRAWMLAPAAAAVLLAALFFRDPNVRLKPDATAIRKPDAAAVTRPDLTVARQPDTAEPVTRSVTNTEHNSVALPPAADFFVEPLVTPPIEFAALDVSPLVTAMPIEIQAIAIDRIEIPPMP
jgi:hypothetical protein